MPLCMRTTLDLDDRLLEKARAEAARRGKSLTSVVEDALAAMLAPRPKGAGRFRLRWKPHRGRYIGGVNLADRVALYEVMEDR